MKIGDKVRLIHGKEEGEIVKLIDNKLVELEIEEGFRIQVLKSEIVVVSGKSDFVKVEQQIEPKPFSNKWNGVYLAFTSINDKLYEVYLINDTAYKTYFVIGEEKEQKYFGSFSGTLEKESYFKLVELSNATFEHWPTYIIQLIFSSHGESKFHPPLIKKLPFRASTFFKNKKYVSILNKEAFLYRLDIDAIKVDAKQLEENMLSPNRGDSKINFSKPQKEVDLHIEKLTTKYEEMNNAEMLQMQLEVFRRNFENAIAANMDEIIFIHGIGNGVLKAEIHKVLSNNKNIKFFQEAQKGKFGYGATLVKFK